MKPFINGPFFCRAGQVLKIGISVILSFILISTTSCKHRETKKIDIVTKINTISNDPYALTKKEAIMVNVDSIVLSTFVQKNNCLTQIIIFINHPDGIKAIQDWLKEHYIAIPREKRGAFIYPKLFLSESNEFNSQDVQVIDLCGEYSEKEFGMLLDSCNKWGEVIAQKSLSD